MKRKYTPEDVDYSFGGMNCVKEEFRIILAKAISTLPSEVVDWTPERLLFISSDPRNYAFTLRQDEWEHKLGIVFLSEELKTLPEKEQTFYIAHEIAHNMLGHRSPIFTRLNEEKTQRQEAEANSLADKWLKIAPLKKD